MSDAAFAAFLFSIAVLTITPGIDTLLVLRNSMRGGVMDGLLTSVGVCSGLFIHATVSAVGISLVILQSAWLFTLLKLCGAGYLIYLGASSLSLVIKKESLVVSSPRQLVSRTGWTRALREGLLSNVLNPKAIVFYMAFLPQFIDPAESALAQSLYLAAIHFGMGIIWLGMIALMAHRMRAWITKGWLKSSLDVVLGVTMIGLGTGLAAQAYHQS